jgi:hypothetical protein
VKRLPLGRIVTVKDIDAGNCVNGAGAKPPERRDAAGVYEAQAV